MITLLSLFPQMNKNDLTEFRTPYLWEKNNCKIYLQQKKILLEPTKYFHLYSFSISLSSCILFLTYLISTFLYFSLFFFPFFSPFFSFPFFLFPFSPPLFVLFSLFFFLSHLLSIFLTHLLSIPISIHLTSMISTLYSRRKYYCYHQNAQ